MQYMICNHNINVGDNVLAIYPAGDCDSGTVIATYPDEDVNGTVSVAIGGRNLMEFLMEDVSHMCDAEEVEEVEVKIVDRDWMNKCNKCASFMDENGMHINEEHDPKHVFDAFHRHTYDNGNFVMWLGGATAKVGHSGVKRHIGNLNVWVSNATANVSGGNVHCGANKGWNKHHSIRLLEDAQSNCDKCKARYGVNGMDIEHGLSHVRASVLLNSDLTFKDAFNVYPQPVRNRR